MEPTRPPYRLPVIRHCGIDYFVDTKLRQFRAVDNAEAFIEFDWPEGAERVRLHLTDRCGCCGAATAPGEACCGRCRGTCRVG